MRIHVIRGGSLSPSLRTAEVTPDDVGEYMIGTDAGTAPSREARHAS